jgi:hypothetical protein
MNRNNNGSTHLSAAERKLNTLAAHCIALERMKDEYHLLLSYLIHKNGGVFKIDKVDIILTPHNKTIVSELNPQTDCLTYTFVETPPEPPKLIIP